MFLIDYVQQFITSYGLFQHDTIQQIQLKHRYALAHAWGVKPGMRILEIGCGQGDTTVVLADLVGEHGKIVALDIASGSYGAPQTLSEAHAVIQHSPLGARISFHVETDFLQFPIDEPFDAIVFSHCSWYFKGLEQLSTYFTKARAAAQTLYFAEWDLHFTQLAQRPHFLAVSLLALYSEFVENDNNVQQLTDAGQMTSLLQQAGFHVQAPQTVEAGYLQDGGWEVAYAKSIAATFDDAPPLIQSLATTYYNMLGTQSTESLNSFVLIAT